MQISINNSQSFGALKIKPEAIEYLKEQSRSNIEKIEKAGEALKDTQYFNLVIGKNGKRTIQSPFANQYIGGTVVPQKPHNEFLHLQAEWAGSDSVVNASYGSVYDHVIKMMNKESAMDAYEKLAKAEQGIERDVLCVKLFDEAEIKRSIKSKNETLEKNLIADKVNELFDKFKFE